jgi:hypothetical protein
LTFFTFCYFLLFFLLLVTFVNYFLLLKVHCLLLFLTFLLLVTFINYFLLLRGARGIILLYLFIVRGEGVRLDFIYLFIFYPWGGGGGTSNCFFFLYIWSVHYARSAGGWRLFDQEKPPTVQGCFTRRGGCFCWLFSFLVTFTFFFIARNFYKLLFTTETGVRFVGFFFFFTVCNFYKLLFTTETGVRFVGFFFFLLFVTFINYFLLLIEVRGIVVLYLFIVQGEGGGS